jgi:acyl transferase domain-containing protein
VVEEAPPAMASPARGWELLLLSARSPEALERATDALAAHFESYPDLALSDVAFTLQVGRRHFDQRRAVLCRPGEDVVGLLRRRDPERVFTWAAGKEVPGVTFHDEQLAALARRWLSGDRPDWAAFHAGERRRRVPLPAYPFDRRRYWLDAPGVPRSLGALS